MFRKSRHDPWSDLMQATVRSTSRQTGPGIRTKRFPMLFSIRSLKRSVISSSLLRDKCSWIIVAMRGELHHWKLHKRVPLLAQGGPLLGSAPLLTLTNCTMWPGVTEWTPPWLPSSSSSLNSTRFETTVTNSVVLIACTLFRNWCN